VAINYAALADALSDLAGHETGRQVLRQTWYDGAFGARPRAEHRALASVPGVQVRLGWMIKTPTGPQQKAVDTLMVRDMVMAAWHRIADDLVLIAADGDLVPGVREAADRGLRVHLWHVSVDDPRVRVSEELVALADRRLQLDPADLEPHVERARPLEQRQRLADGDDDARGTSAGGVATDDVAQEQVFEAESVTDSAGDEGAGEAAVLQPVPRSGAKSAKLGPPPLRQLLGIEETELDLTETPDALVTPAQLGYRYGRRWWESASEEVGLRLLEVARRPGIPRLLDIDLMSVARAHGINTREDEAARRLLRNEFWTGIDAARGATPEHRCSPAWTRSSGSAHRYGRGGRVMNWTASAAAPHRAEG
jgi:uncharacterized LabA/DUF88 family protein